LCSGSGEKPCGRCPDCQKVLKGIHPDVVSLLRNPESRNISVKQARDLRQEVWITPNEAARKVFMIPEADTMNAEAQNALLKVLEEPPAYVAFLLMGRNPGSFLATVRSRCITLRLGTTESVFRENDRASRLMEAFINQDRSLWFTASFACEKMDKERFDQLIEEVDAATSTRAKESQAQQRKQALRLHALLFQVRDMRQVNVSPGHCLGWLCAMMDEKAIRDQSSHF